MLPFLFSSVWIFFQGHLSRKYRVTDHAGVKMTSWQCRFPISDFIWSIGRYHFLWLDQVWSSNLILIQCLRTANRIYEVFIRSSPTVKLLYKILSFLLNNSRAVHTHALSSSTLSNGMPRLFRFGCGYWCNSLSYLRKRLSSCQTSCSRSFPVSLTVFSRVRNVSCGLKWYE